MVPKWCKTGPKTARRAKAPPGRAEDTPQTPPRRAQDTPRAAQDVPRRRLEGVLRRLGRVFGPSWRVLGVSCRVLAASWGRLLAILCDLDPILSKTLDFHQNPVKPMEFHGFSKVVGAILTPSWVKKPSWELSWPSWQPSWTHFSSEVRLKSVLGAS